MPRKKERRDPNTDIEWVKELVEIAEVCFQMRRSVKHVRLGDCEGCVMVPGWVWSEFEAKSRALSGWRNYVG